jgi:hypothetical protein
MFVVLSFLLLSTTGKKCITKLDVHLAQFMKLYMTNIIVSVRRNMHMYFNMKLDLILNSKTITSVGQVEEKCEFAMHFQNKKDPRVIRSFGHSSVV